MSKATNAHQIPEGYEQTDLGIIPNEWRVAKLEDVATIQTGIQKGAKKNGALISMPYIRVANVQAGFLDLSEVKEIRVPKESIQRHLLKPGDVLMTEGGDFDKLGRGSIWNGEIENCLHQNHIFAVRTHPAVLLPYFLNSFSSSERGRKYFLLCSKQSTNLASINSSQLKAFPVPIPPLAEQQKIVAVLKTWDSAIETTQKLIEQLKLRNKGLAQQLLTGKKRLKGFRGEWKNQPLGMYFKERNETGFATLPLLSIGETGVYPQSESNKKDTSNDDKSLYKRICVGDIGYNTMRMWQGRSALSQLEGIVSPAYTIVTPQNNADARFFSYLFKLDSVVHRFFRNSQGLVSDTLNCKFKDFRIVKVDVPPSIEEQRAIAEVLETAEKNFRVCQKYLSVLESQKTGLMQKLLSGEIRVK